jgi:pentatricopeptide repeat protein
MTLKRESLEDEMLQCFSTMISKGYAADLCSKNGHNALRMAQTKKQRQVTIASHSSLLKRLCGEQRADYAFRIFRQMRDNGFQPDAMIYNLMINGASKVGDATTAMDLFASMRKEGFEPEHYMYNQLIHSLCRAGRADDALHVFNDTKLCKDGRDHALFTTLITGLCNLHKVEQACEVFLEMVEEGHKPHHADIKALFPSPNTEGEGSGINVKLYLPLLQNLQQQSKMPTASSIWEVMQSKGLFTWMGL